MLVIAPATRVTVTGGCAVIFIAEVTFVAVAFTASAALIVPPYVG
jgi:hypothetical protein